MKLNKAITDDTEVVFFNLQYQELDFMLPNEVSIRCGDIAPAATEFYELVEGIRNSKPKLSAVTGGTVTNFEWEIDLQ